MRRHLSHLACAPDAHQGHRQLLQRGHRLLRAILLDEAQDRVEHDDRQDRDGILDIADDRRDDRGDDQDQHQRAGELLQENAPGGSAAAFHKLVRSVAAQPRGGLSGAQPLVGRDFQPRGRFGWLQQIPGSLYIASTVSGTSGFIVDTRFLIYDGAVFAGTLGTFTAPDSAGSRAHCNAHGPHRQKDNPKGVRRCVGVSEPQHICAPPEDALVDCTVAHRLSLLRPWVSVTACTVCAKSGHERITYCNKAILSSEGLNDHRSAMLRTFDNGCTMAADSRCGGIHCDA